MWKEPFSSSVYEFQVHMAHTEQWSNHLEYAYSVWNPYHIQAVKALEQIQMRATRIPSSLKNKPYQKRLHILHLPTLKFRQPRGDIIETYKYYMRHYDSTVTPNIPLSTQTFTRGNSLKVVNRCCHWDLRKFSFCNRITNVWNSLPEDIVTAHRQIHLKANTGTSRNLFNWQTEITGTKSRSKVKFFCRVFTARCTLVQSAVLRSHVVCLSVRLSVCL